jgi:hypothetical protein
MKDYSCELSTFAAENFNELDTTTTTTTGSSGGGGGGVGSSSSSRSSSTTTLKTPIKIIMIVIFSL